MGMTQAIVEELFDVWEEKAAVFHARINNLEKALIQVSNTQSNTEVQLRVICAALFPFAPHSIQEWARELLSKKDNVKH